jgi:uncharacterized membrane protein
VKRKLMSLLLAAFLFISLQAAWSAEIKQGKGKVVEIALKDLSNKAVFYDFVTARGSKVTFFALLDSQNKPHIAFNACDVCYQARKGYTVTSEKAVCNNCKNAFSIRLLGTDNQGGGCWPSYLPIKAEKGKVTIAVKDLEAKAYLFP